MDLKPLLSLKYYLSPVPNPDFRYATALLVLGGLMILIGIGIQLYRRKWMKDEIAKKVIRRYPRFLKLFGGLIILLTLMRTAGIPYLSMRLWWVILGLFGLYFILTRLGRFKAEYRSRLERIKENQRIGRFSQK